MRTKSYLIGFGVSYKTSSSTSRAFSEPMPVNGFVTKETVLGWENEIRADYPDGTIIRVFSFQELA